MRCKIICPGSFQVSQPLVKLQKKQFIICSHDNLHVRNVVEICSPVHADTFNAVYNIKSQFK